MPQDLALLQRQPLCGRRVYPWGKLQVTRLDLLMLPPRLVCERASLWAKPPGRQLMKAMRRFQLPRLSRLSYASDVSLAPSLMVRLDWGTDLARYKLRRSRLHKAEQRFLWS